MKCPCCSTILEADTPLPQLATHRCPQGHGVWLGLNTFRDWLRRTQTPAAEGDATPVTGSIIEDSATVLPCPDCGRMLHKYRLSDGLSNRIDRCIHCQGVWFDQGEWDLLVQQGRLLELLDILSDRGQREIRNADTRARTAERYRQRFGDETWGELQRIKAWLSTQEQRSEMWAFLQSDDQV